MSSKAGGAKASRKEEGIKVVSDNRRARFDYEILQTFEAGIELKGSEVKSLRTGHTNLAEAYAAMKGNELWLINSNIPEYREANRFNHEPKRPRKLLLHRREIDRLAAGVLKEHLTIVPLKISGADKRSAFWVRPGRLIETDDKSFGSPTSLNERLRYSRHAG